ncbi:MAG: hypothetical protein ACJ8AD_06150 [Gemmatimonadaceae bacterium]
MTEITDTHRRAALRGRESVARWRIESGVWAGRLVGLFYVVTSLLPVLTSRGQLWGVTLFFLLIAGGILYAAERTRAGSRVAACSLLAFFVVAKLTDGRPLWAGALWTVIIVAALGNGVWGTFALAAARRDALLVPPAPPRGERIIQ